MPPWADRDEMRLLYRFVRTLTAATGVRYSVAHEVPLQSDLVCGLHWHGNMTIKTLAENMAEGNRWWPGMGYEQQELFE